jgi:adenylate kinase
MEKMLNLVLFGPPGAGKGTQSQNLIDKFGLVHLSTGDILRSEIKNGTDLGKKAKEVIDRGELVGDEIVIGMIESKIDENQKAKGFIFDGFPRTIAQAEALDDLLQKKGTGVSGMLALEVNDEELVKRLLLRGKDSGRSDDRDEGTIRKRIDVYNRETLPLKKYYSEHGKFHSIHGIGTVDEIFKALVDRIGFLKAEMDLTALESDIEHLDLTISDYEEADDIAPELLLEIDAIKRAEAEEEDEKRALKRKTRIISLPGKNSKSPKPAKAATRKTAWKTSSPKKAKSKTSARKKTVKRAARKATPKKTARKTVKKAGPGQKTSAKKVSRGKTVARRRAR